MAKEREWAGSDGAIPFGVESVRDAAVSRAALTELVNRLEDGEVWAEAFGRYRRSIGAGDRPALPPPDGRINWTWLTDLDRTERAVDIGSPFGDVSADLALDFARVDYLGAESLHTAAVRLRLSGTPGIRISTAVDDEPTAAHPEGEADLAVFVGAPGWEDRLPEGLARPADLPVRCADLLRPGGWLALLLPNPTWQGLLRRGVVGARKAYKHGILVRELRRGLRRAGYVEVREFLAAHNLDVPVNFVPRDRQAVLNFHRVTHVRGVRDRLARLGAIAPLFPALLLLARK